MMPGWPIGETLIDASLRPRQAIIERYNRRGMQMTQVHSLAPQSEKLWLQSGIPGAPLVGNHPGSCVVVVCVSGSAIVFRNDIENVLSERSRVSDSGRLLSREQMRQSVQRAYPDYTISLDCLTVSNEATEVTIAHGWWDKRRIFDPFTGRDIGLSPAFLFRCSRAGRRLATFAGADGFEGKRASLSVAPVGAVACGSAENVGWKRLNWDLHGAVGFYLLALVLDVLTGAYFPFPGPFRAVINVFTPIDPPLTQQAIRPQQEDASALAGRGRSGSNSTPPPFRIVRRPRTRGQNILRGFSLAHWR